MRRLIGLLIFAHLTYFSFGTKQTNSDSTNIKKNKENTVIEQADFSKRHRLDIVSKALTVYGNDSDIDVSIKDLDINEFVVQGDEMSIKGSLSINGDVLNSVDISYIVNNEDTVTESFTDCDANSAFYFKLSTPIEFIEARDYIIKVYITNPNGIIDNNVDNNSASKIVSVLDYSPKKVVLGEEATGAWCGWCIRGHVIMEEMAETYPDSWIGIAVHNNDPMILTKYDNYIGNYISGYPNGLLDRKVVYDPGSFKEAYKIIVKDITPTVVDIRKIEIDGSMLTFDVRAKFLASVKGARFNAVIKEANVTGDNSDYDQANYYSGGVSGPMGGYENFPDPVPAADMVYQDVARSILGNWDGTENSIAETVTAGEVCSYTYSVNIDDSWDIDNLTIVGMVIGQDGSILNAGKAAVQQVNVTFNVNMGGLVANDDIVYLTGAFCGWTEPGRFGSVAMSDDDGDGIYSTTISVDANSEKLEYKYYLGEGWDTGDMYPDGQVATNRKMIVGIHDITVNDTWIVGVNDVALQEVTIYPNPFTNTLTINNMDVVRQVIIGNILGQKVLEVDVSGHTTEINTNALESGTYMITVIDAHNYARTERIVKL